MKKTIISVIIVVLVIAAGAAVYYHVREQRNNSSQNQQAGQPAPTFADTGKTVEGFPTDLIIGKNTVTASSYAAAGDSNQAQKTANYDTSDSIDSTYNQFLTYFKNKGYTVNSKSESKTSATIYATSGDGKNVATVFLVPDGTQTKATVNYLNK